MAKITTRSETPQEEIELLSNHVKEHFKNAGQLKILEAGCGRWWELDLSGLEYKITGVDLDKNAVEARIANEKDLDEVIIDDLRTVSLQEGHYDFVYNSYVLEHIEGAEAVLDRLFRCLKPNGLLILKIPDRDSVFGFFARNVPHIFLVMFFRIVFKMKEAGTPGHPPYPVVYEKIVSRKGINSYCEKYGHKILSECSSSYYMSHLGLLQFFVKTFIKSIKILSLGKLASDHNDLSFVIKKNSLPESE